MLVVSLLLCGTQDTSSCEAGQQQVHFTVLWQHWPCSRIHCSIASSRMETGTANLCRQVSVSHQYPHYHL